MKNGVQILLALVIAVCGLGAVGGWLDSFDYSEEWAVSQTILEAQDAAIAENEKQRIAQVYCQATAGESVVVWREDGEFTCKARKGKK